MSLHKNKSLIIHKKYRQYREEDLLSAINNVKNGDFKLYAAAKQFGIPTNTLRDKLKEKNEKKKGAPQIISDESEKKIAAWIVDCAAKGDPRSKAEVLNAAKQFDAYENKPPRFNKNGPSKKWFKGFMERHDNIVFRKPESIGKASATVCIKDIQNFFEQVLSWLKNNGLEYLLSRSDAIYNLDETCFSLNAHPDRVLAKRGTKSVYTVNAAGVHENITCTFCFSASGETLRTQIIYNKSFSHLNDVCYTAGQTGKNFCFALTNNGWQTSQSFKSYLEKLDEDLTAKNVERPVIFFFDGHSSHTNIELYLWAKEKQIIIITLPPNTTHLLQPCDTSIFGPLKKSWKKEVSNYKHEMQKNNLDQCDFIRILSKSMDKVLIQETIRNGFKGSGLYPFDNNNVHCERIIGSSPDYTTQNNSEFVAASAFTHKTDHDNFAYLNNATPSYHEDAFLDNYQNITNTDMSISSNNIEDQMIETTENSNNSNDVTASLVKEMLEKNQKLLTIFRNQNSEFYFCSQVIEQQLRIMSLQHQNAMTQSSSNKQIVTEPILQPPAQHSRKATGRKKKVLNFVMTADEVIESHLAALREKERLEKEKEERKIIREQKRLIRENAAKIKKELAEKRLENQPSTSGKEIKKRGRKPKIIN
ncbi:hypothetical protein PVAND_005220 [Polypedilum vanderplanki]|uniref:HTH CENPB-type domain-containing protein n=1 Tax=Polypedilum vanderplanki TaxID=319348 RepID=A0A9J6C0E1_POLVA|nr:hypothetical protein PVAND_005220 [Polypedilum vanderplanki]